MGLVLVALWVATLGWHARRLYLQPEAEQLARAARTLPPGVAYYAVYRGDRHVGWARSEVDTLPSHAGFLVSERLEVDLGSVGLGGRAQVRSEARLGPALALESFGLEATGLLGGVTAEGEVRGDSLLEIRVERGGRSTRRSVALDGSVVLGTTLPMRIAAEGGGAEGDRYEITTFDPTSMELERRTVEILERDLRTFPDSVETDSVSGEWRIAGRDTVLAWKIDRNVAGTGVVAWVDEDGRYVELTTGLGLRLERTAFELAYWGRDRPARRDSGRAARPPTPEARP